MAQANRATAKPAADITACAGYAPSAICSSERDARRSCKSQARRDGKTGSMAAQVIMGVMDGLRKTMEEAAWETKQIVLCRNRNGVGSGLIGALRRVAVVA